MSDPVLTQEEIKQQIDRAMRSGCGVRGYVDACRCADAAGAEIERLTRERVEKRERELVCTLCGSTGCKEDGKPQITRAEFKRREEER